MAVTSVHAHCFSDWKWPAISDKLLFLIPTISGIALGILFLPNFGLGMVAGLGLFAAGVVVEKVVDWIGLAEEDKEQKSEYSNFLEKNLLSIALFGPIAEEAIFRGGIQPFLTHAVQLLIPATAAILCPSFTIATTVSIVATAILFGAIHLSNPHKGAVQQSVFAAIAGVAFGALSAQFGIGAAIAAHVVNNTIIATMIGFNASATPTEVDVQPRVPSDYFPLPV